MANIIAYNGILPKIADDAFIANNATIIGDVEIGPGANIWYNVVVRGDVRRANEAQIDGLARGTSPERLWRGPFTRMGRAKAAAWALQKPNEANARNTSQTRSTTSRP